jgi:hypothetical protein
VLAHDGLSVTLAISHTGSVKLSQVLNTIGFTISALHLPWTSHETSIAAWLHEVQDRFVTVLGSTSGTHNDATIHFAAHRPGSCARKDLPPRDDVAYERNFRGRHPGEGERTELFLNEAQL